MKKIWNLIVYFWNIIKKNKYFLLFMLFMYFVFLSGKNSCSRIFFSKDILNFIDIIYNKGLIIFMEKFQWSFLLLLLFLPPFYKKFDALLDKLSKNVHTYAYLKDNQNIKLEDFEEHILKEDFVQSKNQEIKELVSSNTSKLNERDSKYLERQKKEERLENGINEYYRNNYKNYVSYIKLKNISNDLMENMHLSFDGKFDKSSRTHCYVKMFNIVMLQSIMIEDRLYKYLSIINDQNSRISRIRYIIILPIVKDESNSDDSLDSFIKKLQPSINNGILEIHIFNKKLELVQEIK